MSDKPTKPLRRGVGRVAFLRNVELFRTLDSQGYPQRTIYHDHAEALGISYSQFNRYMARYVRNKELPDGQQDDAAPALPFPAPEGSGEPTADAGAAPAEAPAKQPGQVGAKFAFDPNRKPDDLI